MYCCPDCRSALEHIEGTPLTCRCGAVYPLLPAGGFDFLQGREFSDFQLSAGDSKLQDLLAQEAAGVSWRVESFLLPMIRRYSEATGKESRDLSVLDCGCGSGISVEILRAHGISAFGIDAGRSRHLQWRERTSRSQLHSANALRLPFQDAGFDFVFSSGLIEHIGIHEEISSEYRAHRLPDCHGQRGQFVREMVRVLKGDGFLLIDHPNGGFPVDFWHGSDAGSMRWHFVFGDMLPRYSEVKTYLRSADPDLRLLSLSPIHRLRFRQVGRHRYGRALAPVASAWLRAMNTRWLSPLARSFLNPYLVTVATRLRRRDWVRP